MLALHVHLTQKNIGLQSAMTTTPQIACNLVFSGMPPEPRYRSGCGCHGSEVRFLFSALEMR
jgi:hypothetical protein